MKLLHHYLLSRDLASSHTLHTVNSSIQNSENYSSYFLMNRYNIYHKILHFDLKCVSKKEMRSIHASSSFLACNSRLRSATRRYHPPQRAVLSQIGCFWERKVVLFQILLDVYTCNKFFKKLPECARIVLAAVAMLLEQRNSPRRLCNIDDDESQAYAVHNYVLISLSIRYADVLEHTSHTAYIKDSFSVSSSSVTSTLLIRPSIKGNARLIASVLERFYNMYSTMCQ